MTMPQIAFWLETDSQHACELAALCGFDALIVDREHGIASDKDADRVIPYAKQLGLAVYSRVSEAERAPIQHALDCGADGIILPQILGVEHARVATGYAKFPPLGTRGVGYSRTMHYGATTPEWIEGQNRSTLCYAQIETLGALDAAEEIAQLPSVDGLFYGPSDASMARGRGPNRWTKADIADLTHVADAARKAGKLFATTGAEAAKSREAGINAGAAMLTAGDDLTAMKLGFTQLIQAARKGG